MRSMSAGAACCADMWGYLTVPFACTTVYIRATLRHFDNKLASRVKMALIIPCERRLAEMEISENQEVTFQSRFGNRDYGRPYGHFSVTLHGFD